MGGASQKLVGQRRQEMEGAGLIKREVISDRPSVVVYAITDFGRSALDFLEILKVWVESQQI